MPKFFFDFHLLNENSIVLSGETAHHLIRVLRVRCGDSLTLCDGMETDYCCIIADITNNPCQLALQVADVRASQSESATKITLYQALTKGDKMDGIIQKSVELGVHAIVPIVTERTEVRVLKKERLARYQRIAAAAAEQSMRGIIPAVMPAMTFDQVVALYSDNTEANDERYRNEAETRNTLYRDGTETRDAPCHNCADAWGTPRLLMAYENERQFTLRMYLSGQKPAALGVLIGPEGGFSDAEAALFAAGVSRKRCAFSLGPRVLRTETAGLAALAQIACLLEDLP